MQRLDFRLDQMPPALERKDTSGFPHLVAVSSRGLATKNRGKCILVINGHPDPRPERFCAALCDAYMQGARKGGWVARALAIGTIDGSDSVEHPSSVRKDALEAVRWADALIVVFPLWLDAPPAPLRDFFALAASEQTKLKPARLIVTMEMPAFAHRRKLWAKGTSNPVSLPGVSGELTFIGSVNTISAALRADWLARLETLGSRGE